MFQSLVVQPLTQLLVRLNEAFAQLPLPPAISSYALALIAIAVIVKLVTYPLTRSQMRSMRSMQELQPRMKEIQKQYKGDREVLAQKQMELYKEHGVNPFGGCLPLVIQIPLLIGLFQAIQSMAGELAGQRFFWIDDLAAREPLPWTDPAGIPLLLILLVASQFAYQKFLTPPTAGGDSAEAMAQMTKFMPLMFGFFFYRLPAGVLLYYTAFNVVSLAQQYWINTRMGHATTQMEVVADGSPSLPPPEASGQQETVTNDSGQRKRRNKKR